MIDTSSGLLQALLQAHSDSALRGNISHKALQLAAAGSHNYIQSICAAMLTLGGTHAPLLATYDLLVDPRPDAAAEILLMEGKRVPGWGNAFVKDRPDPLWIPVEALLSDATRATIMSVTDALHGHGKHIFPNPSCYTAACAIEMNMPREIAPYLFVSGRLGAWTQEYARMRGLS